MLRDRSLVPLSHQHHNGLAFCVLTERSLAGSASEANVAKLARYAIDRYEIELTNHFDLEEGTLFPAIRDELGDLPLVHELVAEHRKIEALIEMLRHTPSQRTLHELVTLLRSHIRREENELFQEVQKRLSREGLDRIGAVLDERAVRVCLEPPSATA